MGIVPLIFLVLGIVAATIILAALEQGWRPNIEEEKEAFDRKVLHGDNPLAVKAAFFLPFIILYVVLEKVAGLGKGKALVITLCLYAVLTGVIWYLFHKSTKGKTKKQEEELISEAKDKPRE